MMPNELRCRHSQAALARTRRGRQGNHYHPPPAAHRLCPARRWVPIGSLDNGQPVLVPGSQGSALTAGDTRAGQSYLAGLPAERWIDAGYTVLILDPEGDHLLRCYGIPMVGFVRADDADTAVAAAAGFGGHVVIKADVPGLLHKTAAGAVELDLHGAGEVRAAMGRLQDRSPSSTSTR